MKIAPCKGCERRAEGCHGQCEDYKEWKAEHDEQNRRRQLDQESWREFFAARKRMMKKRDKEMKRCRSKR